MQPLPDPDGLVHLRRKSDWSDEPRPGDEAAQAAYRAAPAMATAALVEHDGGTASHSDDVVTLTLALAPAPVPPPAPSRPPRTTETTMTKTEMTTTATTVTATATVATATEL